jgi:hypothetical protein
MLTAQKAEIFEKIRVHSYDDHWNLYSENAQVKIYYKYSDCSKPDQGFHFEYVLFKVENKTNDQLQVTWSWDYSYGNKPRPYESDDEIGVLLELMPGAQVQADCSAGNGDRLKLFVQDRKRPDMRTLSDFSINNLDVRIQ